MDLSKHANFFQFSNLLLPAGLYIFVSLPCQGGTKDLFNFCSKVVPKKEIKVSKEVIKIDELSSEQRKLVENRSQGDYGLETAIPVFRYLRMKGDEPRQIYLVYDKPKPLMPTVEFHHTAPALVGQACSAAIDEVDRKAKESWARILQEFERVVFAQVLKLDDEAEKKLREKCKNALDWTQVSALNLLNKANSDTSKDPSGSQEERQALWDFRAEIHRANGTISTHCERIKECTSNTIKDYQWNVNSKVRSFEGLFESVRKTVKKDWALVYKNGACSSNPQSGTAINHEGDGTQVQITATTPRPPKAKWWNRQQDQDSDRKNPFHSVPADGGGGE